MKCITVIIYLLFCLLTYSCKKEVNTDNQNSTYVDSSLLFLDNAISDSCNENGFYIKGAFNGKKLCFATTGASGSYLADTFMNAFYIYHNQDVITNDNIYLIRQNSDQSIMVAFYCGQTHIKDRSFPYTQPNSNLEQCEFTEMEFINMRSGSNVGQNSPRDNYTFKAISGFGINITFAKLTSDNIIEGNFEGIIKTNTGSSITVKDGKFRIKFIVDNVDVNNGTTTGNMMTLSRQTREEMLSRSLRSN